MPREFSLKLVREFQSHCSLLSRLELRAEAYRLKELVLQSCEKSPASIPELSARSIALASESIRRETGFELFECQLRAALAIVGGNIVELATGEGKTLATTTAAIALALHQRGVHISTPNEYLSNRDAALTSNAANSLGLSVGSLQHRDDLEQKCTAYNKDITYGPGYEFGFDCMRDRLSQAAAFDLSPGTRILERLNDEAAPRLQRPLAFSIVDEADHVLIDDAISPLVLSAAEHSYATDESIILQASELASRLSKDDLEFVGKAVRIRADSNSMQAVKDAESCLNPDLLLRPWETYVELAASARFLYQPTVDYIIKQNQVQIVDQGTGRIHAERKWQFGLQQAIESKEGIRPSAEQAVLAQLTCQQFYSSYEFLGGLTGTTTDCEKEFRQVYGVKVRRISRRLPCQRTYHGLRSFVTKEQKLQAIVASTAQQHASGMPVLIGTHSIRDSHRIADLLKTLDLQPQLLTGCDEECESAIISQAGQSGSITVATNLAGRGTDIQLDNKAKCSGGLHVIVSEPHESSRVDQQLMGRSARQGDPGSCQIFMSAEDDLLVLEAPWVSKAIRRMSAGGELKLDISSKLRQLQKGIAQRRFQQRLQLIQQARVEQELLQVN
ncbi:MAG: preprotein translocase subunit SecA [Planctomycetota bacterium]